MKRARHTFPYPLGVILTVVALIGTVVLEAVAFAQINPSWIPTGSLNTPRSGHTATLLPNGVVLVAGGSNNNSAELYDPETGLWTLTGSPFLTRFGRTATLLPEGKVLVVGGFGGTSPSYTISAEIYDPGTGTWSATGSLNQARAFHTATLLQNGKVLVAGGTNDPNFTDPFPLNSAELYDPATGTWSITGNLNEARQDHTATLLPNGKVLVAGGWYQVVSTELYDPTTGTWNRTGNLNNIFHGGHTATLLPNDKVLIAGGWSGFSPISSVELYDPAIGGWRVTASLNTPRSGHTATLLPNGEVLVVGGSNDNSAELYDPATGVWGSTASLNTPRISHTATLLPSAKVLVAGGYGGTVLTSAELYGTPVTLSLTGLSANLISPQPLGTSIIFTATASDGTPPVQFKWWVFNGAVWSVGQNWSTSNTFNWTPSVGGDYIIGVWARSSGNTTDAPENNALQVMSFTITKPADLTVTSLISDKASPQPLGSTVLFTATASGGMAPVQFKWWVFNGAVWSVGQNWSTSNAFNWKPSVGGGYIIGVWVRSNGNIADAPENNALLTISFTITAPAGLSVTGLSADKASPQSLGITVTFAATASGGTPPVQFKWWVFNGVVWSVGQNWSTSNTFSWTPAVGGNYIIGVWARSNGNDTDWPENNALRTMNFTITGPPALTVTNLIADKPSPQPFGSTVLFTATASGGRAPLQFKWWVFNGAVWSVGKDWSTSNTFNWTPAAGGDYIIGVWARSNGNNTDWPENNAIGVINFTVASPAGALVRAFSDVPYSFRVTSSEGYTWFADAGSYSAYQLVTSPTLTNFEVQTIESVYPLSQSFNIVPGRRYVLVLTNFTDEYLLLIDEGAMDLAVQVGPFTAIRRTG